MSQLKSRLGIVVAFCGVAVLCLLLLGRCTDRDLQQGAEIPVRAVPEIASSSTPERIESAALSTQSTDQLFRTVVVKDRYGSAIPGASLWLCADASRTRNPSSDHRLGLTGVDGTISIGSETLGGRPEGFLAISKDSYLPELRSISEVPATGPIAITLESAASFAVRCTDIDGAAVPGVNILLSPLGIPSELAQAHDAEADVDGLDMVSAIHSRVTDSNGNAVFGNVARKRYHVQVVSEVYEIADRALFTVEVPGPVLELRLTLLLAIVIMAEDDEVLSYSMGTGAECLAVSPNALSTRRMQAKLGERYPKAAVILGASANSAMPCDRYTVDLLLAKAGPVRVDARFMPITPDFSPLVIPKRDLAEEQLTAEVTFTVSSVFEMPSSFREIVCSRRSAGGRHEVRVPQDGKLRLPYGEWEITSRNTFARAHFVPEHFVISNPSETVAIRMTRHLVPCRLAAVGYRGEPIRQGALQLTAAGIHHAMMGPNLDQLTLWLPPGTAQFQLSSVGYVPAIFVATVLPVTEEEMQTIPVQLVVR